MSHAVTYNSEPQIVESILQGKMTLSETEEIVAKIAKIAKENVCRLILMDFREVSRILSILEIYELPDRIKSIFASYGINVSFYKRAIVVAKDRGEYVFHENVMVNRGQREKVFTDMDQAKEWLTENSVALQRQLLPCSDGYYPKEKRP